MIWSAWENWLYRIQPATAVMWLTVLATGCVSSNKGLAPEVTEAARQKIYLRASGEFSNVILIKPETVDPESLQFRMAPLIFIQAQSKAAGFPGRSPKIPLVHFCTNTVLIRGKKLDQLTYFWKLSESSAGKSAFQGVRMTLDSTGNPIFWEVLHDSSGAKLIYVSQGLEIDAAKEFGRAHAGRLCSMERPVSETPTVIVPNVVDDGPVPMGPVIYLSESGDVQAIACRCSELQAAELDGQNSYRIDVLTDELAKARLKHQFVRDNDGGEWFDAGRVERSLRLPGTF